MKMVYDATISEYHATGGSIVRAKVLRLQDLRIPIHIALGRYEAATQEELDELITDLKHELDRRAA